MTYSAIDLSRLPPVELIETLAPETVIAEVKAAFLAELPELADVLELKSEPSVKIIELIAYFIILFRADVNDGGRAVMLATATGAKLDNIAATWGVSRLQLSAADPEAIPPIPAVFEADVDLRRRTQLAMEGRSTAGPIGAYVYHSLSASADVLDVSVTSPTPGAVRIVVLSRGGAPSPALLTTVAEAVNADNVRPLCDAVTVVPAELLEYSVEAEIHVFDGPDAEAVRAAAEDAVRSYVAETARLGRTVRVSGLLAALHRPGVEQVNLLAPEDDIEAASDEAPWCGSTSVVVA